MYGFVLDALKFSQCLGKESWHVLIFETKTSGWTSQVPSDAQCNRILPFKIMCTLCGSEPQTTCGHPVAIFHPSEQPTLFFHMACVPSPVLAANDPSKS